MTKTTQNSEFYEGVGEELNPRKPYGLAAAANAIRVTERALLKAVSDNQVRARKVGRYWTFTGKALVDFLEGKKVR